AHNTNPGSVFAGFDTFTGLPEDWGNVKKGSFSNDGDVPYTTDQRITFCVGLVQDTLPAYLKKENFSGRLIFNLDFDLYNATLFSLVCIEPFLKKGDIIIMDEYFSITKNHHEYRAFHDFQSLYKFEYKPLYKCRGGQYVIEIL
ncbi:MAG: TylF/MycF/NovP-related O-methyltransferase, partial [Ferruginibacter sp.]